MLQLDNVHFAYDAPVLQGVDLHVEAGEHVALLGPSGCGKSTLLRVIAGLETPRQGRIGFNGNDLTDVPTHARRMGLMFQEPTLFPHLSVLENVAFGVRYRDDGADDDVAMQELDAVGLADRGDSRVDELSGGQRQRVALARTLAANPRMVLLDEPLSSLDADLRQELGARIRQRLQAAKVPALWVTHDHDEARRIADRIVRMDQGKLVSNA